MTDSNTTNTYYPQARELSDKELNHQMDMVDSLNDTLNSMIDSCNCIGWDIYSIKRELQYRGRKLWAEWARRQGGTDNDR